MYDQIREKLAARILEPQFGALPNVDEIYSVEKFTIDDMQEQMDSEFHRQILGSHLHRAFRKRCRQVLDESTSHLASPAFTSFASSFSNPGMKWKKGMRTIRELIDQSAPENLDQVICCLLVADAMRRLGEDTRMWHFSSLEYV
jgi:hypothetical protein